MTTNNVNSLIPQIVTVDGNGFINGITLADTGPLTVDTIQAGASGNITITGNINLDGNVVTANSLATLTVANIATGIKVGELILGANNSGVVSNVGLKPASNTANYTLTLPASAGSNLQVLTTDGNGNLSWTTGTPGGSNSQMQYNANGLFAGTDGLVVDFVDTSSLTSVLDNVTTQNPGTAISFTGIASDGANVLAYGGAGGSSSYAFSSTNDGNTWTAISNATIGGSAIGTVPITSITYTPSVATKWKAAAQTQNGNTQQWYLKSNNGIDWVSMGAASVLIPQAGVDTNPHAIKVVSNGSGTYLGVQSAQSFNTGIITTSYPAISLFNESGALPGYLWQAAQPEARYSFTDAVWTGSYWMLTGQNLPSQGGAPAALFTSATIRSNNIAGGSFTTVNTGLAGFTTAIIKVGDRLLVGTNNGDIGVSTDYNGATTYSWTRVRIGAGAGSGITSFSYDEGADLVFATINDSSSGLWSSDQGATWNSIAYGSAANEVLVQTSINVGTNRTLLSGSVNNGDGNTNVPWIGYYTLQPLTTQLQTTVSSWNYTDSTTANRVLVTRGNGLVAFSNVPASGSNTQVQYNNGGVMGAISTMTTDGSNLTISSANLTLPAIANIHIPAGNAGQAIITDGNGNLSWGNTGNPAGANRTIQFNANGVFGGIAGVTATSGNNGISLAVANLALTGGSNGQFLRTDGNGNLSFSSPPATITPYVQNVVSSSATSYSWTETVFTQYSGNTTLPLYYNGTLVNPEDFTLDTNTGNLTYNLPVVAGDVLAVPPLTYSNADRLVGGNAGEIQFNSSNTSFAGANTLKFDAANNALLVQAISPVSTDNFQLKANTAVIINRNNPGGLPTDTGEYLSIGGNTSGNVNAPIVLGINSNTNTYSGLRLSKSGTERWFIGADNSSNIGNFVLNTAGTQAVTVINTNNTANGVYIQTVNSSRSNEYLLGSLRYAYNNVPIGVQTATSTILIPNLPFTQDATNTGYWTNTASIPRKFNISFMTTLSSLNSLINVSQAAIWFQRQNTFTGASGADRYAQVNQLNTGNPYAMLSTSWTFVLQPNQTLAVYGYCVDTSSNGELNIGGAAYGLSAGAASRLVITELL